MPILLYSMTIFYCIDKDNLKNTKYGKAGWLEPYETKRRCEKRKREQIFNKLEERCTISLNG